MRVTKGCLRTMLVIIGEGDPGDLSSFSAEQISRIMDHVENNSHRDTPSVVAMANVLMAEKKREH